MEATVKRIRRLVEVCGAPSRIEPGPTAQRVMVRWAAGDSGMRCVEFEVETGAADAVATVTLALEPHDWHVTGLTKGEGHWQFECKRCGEVCETEVATGVGGERRYGCKG